MNLHVLLPIILIPAKLLEEIMRRIHFPTVVGAILAEIVLGPTLLGVIPSRAHDPEAYDTVH
jgi:Kef-type K+ transport system membrane component KefB